MLRETVSGSASNTNNIALTDDIIGIETIWKLISLSVLWEPVANKQWTNAVKTIGPLDQSYCAEPAEPTLG